MSTLLDERAKKVRFAAGEQAKRNIAARQAEQKKRIAASKAKEKKRADEVRANGVKEIDIFHKKQAAAVEEAQAANEDAKPREEQRPKTSGSLVGRLVGAMDATQAEQLRLSLAAAAEFMAFAAEAFESEAARLAEDGILISPTCGSNIGSARTWLDSAESYREGAFKVFRARKGEEQ